MSNTDRAAAQLQHSASVRSAAAKALAQAASRTSATEQRMLRERQDRRELAQKAVARG